jgi:hypothetical protein
MNLATHLHPNVHILAFMDDIYVVGKPTDEKKQVGGNSGGSQGVNRTARGWTDVSAALTTLYGLLGKVFHRPQRS